MPPKKKAVAKVATKKPSKKTKNEEADAEVAVESGSDSEQIKPVASKSSKKTEKREKPDTDVTEKKEVKKQRKAAVKKKEEEEEADGVEDQPVKTIDEEPVKKKEKKVAAKSKNPKTKKDEDNTEKEEEIKEKRPRRGKTVDKEDEQEEKPVKPTRSRKKRVLETEDGDESEEEPKKSKKQPSKAEKQPKEKKTLLNPTKTTWDSVDFACSRKSKNGENHNFHIMSWNVDGIRAWLKKDGLSILEAAKPNILCLQETKCNDSSIPEEMQNIDGYEIFWCHSEKSGYAGVCILTKDKPVSVTEGIGIEEHDDEGRCLTAEFNDFYLVNVYVPNSGRKLVTLPKRLKWNESFKEYVNKLNNKKPVIVCGDMNVSHKEIDLANPKTNKRNAGFTEEERSGLTDFLNKGYVDTFRELYPEKEKVYTFWTYMAQARTKNVGWRLDYFITSQKLLNNLCDNVVHQQVLGSDHCPISLFLKF